MNSVFFAHLKTRKRFRFHKEILTKVASISIAFKQPLLWWSGHPSVEGIKRDGANNSLRFFDQQKAGMTEPREKSYFILGLDCKINRSFLIMLPTLGKFGLNVVTKGNV